MHPRTRQRLIGLLLLALLAAILAPLVLRSPEEVRVALDMALPASPTLETTTVIPVIDERERESLEEDIEADQRAVAETGEAALEAEPEPDKPEPESTAGEEEPEVEARVPPAPEADDESQNGTLPKAGFTVQVASFSDQANAETLVQRLRDADYNAYYRVMEQDGNTLQRVFVGPEIQRQDAEATKQRLNDDKRFALDGLVRTFVP